MIPQKVKCIVILRSGAVTIVIWLLSHICSCYTRIPFRSERWSIRCAYTPTPMPCICIFCISIFSLMLCFSLHTCHKPPLESAMTASLLSSRVWRARNLIPFTLSLLYLAFVLFVYLNSDAKKLTGHMHDHIS